MGKINTYVTRKNSEHYDLITDGWRYIFGDNFHWGYFLPETDSLTTATKQLIEELAVLGTFTEQSRVLDVGCGIGEPAFYLHEKFHCPITGISISKKGIELARQRCQERGYTKVQFSVMNAFDTNLPDNSIDITWVMESSHLMRDKPELLREMFRVLCSSGELLLCDVMVSEKLDDSTVRHHFQDLKLLERVFGKMQHEPLEHYVDAAKALGFTNITTRDVTHAVFPTIHHHRRNIQTNKEMLMKYIPPQMTQEFLSACDVLDCFFRKGILRYGFLKAVKP